MKNPILLLAILGVINFGMVLGCTRDLPANLSIPLKGEIRKGYFITEATGLCSDTGHMAVDDIDTCKEAAEELKRKFGGVEDSAIRLNGCHVHDNDVFFNQKSTGYGSWLASQICKPKGCECDSFVNAKGYGACKTGESNDRAMCYVKNPETSICTDLKASSTNPDKKWSYTACEQRTRVTSKWYSGISDHKNDTFEARLRQEGEECGGCFYPPPYFADPETCAPGLECKHVDPLQKSFGKTCVRPAKCSEVDVLHTKHWTDGNTGEYFYFSATDFDEMLGRSDWDGETFNVVQEGSQEWSGKVKVWKKSLLNKGPNGRRASGSKPGQWRRGDTIALQECRVADGYVCEEKVCHSSDYIEGEDWGYYSKSDIGCFECQKRCNADKNCGGVECNSGYCSWWKWGKCSNVGCDLDYRTYYCRKRKNDYKEMIINKFEF